MSLRARCDFDTGASRHLALMHPWCRMAGNVISHASLSCGPWQTAGHILSLIPSVPALLTITIHFSAKSALPLAGLHQDQREALREQHLCQVPA